MMTPTPLFPPAPVAAPNISALSHAAMLELSFRRAMPQALTGPQPPPPAPIRADLLGQARPFISTLKAS